MKKKVYVALLSLCCPIMLNTQQVFAEEVASETAPTSETVAAEEGTTESGPEEVPVESAPEVSEEAPVATEETQESTEETSNTVVEETEVSEETVESTETPKEAPVEEEKAARALVNFEVSFVDETTGALIGTAPISKEEGTVAVIALPTNGYFVVDTPVNSGFSVELDENLNPYLVGTVTAATTDFTVTMRAFNASGDAQINFVDEAGNPVNGAPNVMLGGEVGEVVSYDPPVIPGYTYSGGTVSVTLTDTLQEIPVVYTRVETKLTVTYLDTAGNPLIADETYTGKYGEVYAFTPASFSGLELISFNGAPFSEADLPITVTMGETDQHFVLVYGAPVVIDEPAPYEPSQIDPVVPVVEEVRPAVQPMATKEVKPKSAKVKKSLPETGEKENMVVAAAGMILVAQAAYVLKKKKENEFGL
ncbi:MucBP domain-containing protein [Candidatus Enterococcus clewellii]|uniref:Gram-positive cocci surface proteins LPxTG domain-containing protein n=1 Tax=Candidatus Enterococcus clewellii TaxID=1834193 RepID=A0A242K8K9_9ENTE|nr:MucBP domain-containing protein [Enterococcus sp. 9E7_DIV0242]OTP17118.1 hypothetical protein A5888_001256 [Enterococcus sp. 9E7_DIV0242]